MAWPARGGTGSHPQNLQMDSRRKIRMTRFAIAAAGFLALFALAANEASALTSTTRQCISRERKAYRDALRAARAGELRTFQGKYSDCFGPGAGCGQGWQLDQTNCQDGPKKAQDKCGEDNDAQGRDDPNFTSCGDIFEDTIKNDCNQRA